MIHHIVMIKLKPFSGKEERMEKAKEIKAELDKLPAIINEIKSFEVGLNILESDRASEVVIVSSFESLETLDVYRVHPEHQKVVKLIGEYAERVTANDFER